MTPPRPAPPAPARRVTVDGAAWGIVAEAVALPLALLTAAFLTRQFGPDGYGAYALAVTLVVWVESVVVAFLGRATVRFVSAEGNDRDRVATTALRLFVAAGVVVGGAVWVSAPAVAGALGVPAVDGYLRLLALSPPLAATLAAHEFVLVGRRQYRPRALLRVVLWAGRLGGALALVLGGLGVEGALWAVVGASAVALAVARVWARPAVWGPAFPVRPILGYAAPLLAFGLALRLLRQVDLFALKGFGATVAEAGYYTAAQNLALIPAMVSLAISPLVLASVGQSVGSGNLGLAREMSRDALRAPFLLLPFAALGAGAAPPIIRFVYGEAFAPAAALLPPLLLAGMALVAVAAGANILVAAGRPRVTMALTVPLVAVLVAVLAWVVPRYGAGGAAVTAAAVAVVGAAAMFAVVRSVWGAAPTWATVARSAAASAVAYAAGSLVSAGGAALVVVLAVLSIAIVGLLRVLGAIGDRDLDAARSLLPTHPAP